TTGVALDAAGTIGTSNAARLAVDTPLLAADAGTSAFLSSGAVTLNTVNGVSNTAGTTYDLSTSGTVTVTGGVSAANTYLTTSAGNIVGAGTVTGTTGVALDASGTIGTSNAARLAVDTPLLAADAGTSAFLSSGAVTLNTVNGVSNTAGTTYDLSTSGTVTVTGGVSAANTYLTTSAGNIAGAGTVTGTTGVALDAAGTIGTSNAARLAVDTPLLAADAGTSAFLSSGAVTLNTVNGVSNTAGTTYDLSTSGTVTVTGGVSAANTYLTTSAGNIAGAGTVTGTTGVALDAAGTIGTSNAARLAVDTPLLAADAGTSAFLSSGAVTLNTVNGVSNTAGTTYDLSTSGTVTVTGGVSAANTYLTTSAGNIAGAGTVTGTTGVALDAAGTIGTSNAARLAVDTPLLAADAGTSAFLSSGAVTLNTVNGVSNTAGTTYDLSTSGTVTVTGGVSAANTYLTTSAGNIAGAGTVTGTTGVALDAAGTIGTSNAARLAVDTPLLAADAGTS